jgi:hypothetical protein|tara:strand:- start:228 stop:761 length:534 start_codon:yes stop_codon:yes gene_type:complete
MFFWAARFNSINANNIALRTFLENAFEIDAFLEIYGNRSGTFGTSPVNFNEFDLFKSPTVIDAGEPGEFRMDWSINVESTSDAERYLRIVPFAAGQLLWGSADVIQHRWPLNAAGDRDIAIPDDDGAHSLSGQVNFLSSTSRFEVGLVAMTIFGNLGWTVCEYSGFDANIIIDRVVR